MKNLSQRGLYFVMGTLLIAFLFIQCEKNWFSSDDSTDTGTVAGLVTDLQQLPLEGIVVSIEDKVVFTGAEGTFLFEDIEVGNRVYLLFEAAGFADNFKVVEVFKDETSEVNAVMAPIGNTASFDASQAISASFQGAKVEIPGGSLVDEDGTIFNGTATVETTYFNPTDPSYSALFPGDFMGVTTSGEEVPIESYGFIDVSIEGAGAKLNLKNGSVADIQIPIPNEILSNAPNPIPLWYFDEDTGVWQEEGSATIQGDAYVGQVSHFSRWNADISFADQISYIEGHTVDQDGAPLAMVRVEAIGFDYIGAGVMYSDENGYFKIPVKSNSIVEIYTIFQGSSINHRKESTPGPGQTRDIGEVVLLNISYLTGMVTDELGNTLFQALVTALDPGFGNTTARTDANGRFKIPIRANTRLEIFAEFNNITSPIQEEDTPYPGDSWDIGTLVITAGWNHIDITFNDATYGSLLDVFFIDDTYGWAVGVNAVIRSTDGGLTWNEFTPAGSPTLADVHFVNQSEGWAAGLSSTVIHSSDGGINWEFQPIPVSWDLLGLHFEDNQNGWVVGYGILHTSDGGSSWDVQKEGIGFRLMDVQFVNLDIGWAVGENSTIFKTIDGGLTWFNQDAGVGSNLGVIRNVFFINSQKGWATFGSDVLRTTDGGSTWNLLDTGGFGGLQDIYFVDELTGWAVGDQGRIIHTINGGDSWTDQQSGIINTLPSVHFYDADLGWIAAGKKILITN